MAADFVQLPMCDMSGPRQAAICRAVYPLLALACRAAPRPSRHFTTSGWSCQAAAWRGGLGSIHPYFPLAVRRWGCCSRVEDTAATSPDSIKVKMPWWGSAILDYPWGYWCQGAVLSTISYQLSAINYQLEAADSCGPANITEQNYL